MKLLPSIAAADPIRIADELDRLQSWPAIHVDIEDGNFAPNITFGRKTLEAVCSYSAGKEIDVHLMVTDPLRWLEILADTTVCRVCAHLEALRFPMQFINRARELGMKAGLAINIGTSAMQTEPFWGIMDYLLVMTSEPDLNGEKLYRPALHKAIGIARRLPENLELYVDGGVTYDALVELNKVPITGAVLGRLVFSAPDPLLTLREISKRLANEGENTR